MNISNPACRRQNEKWLVSIWKAIALPISEDVGSLRWRENFEWLRARQLRYCANLCPPPPASFLVLPLLSSYFFLRNFLGSMSAEEARYHLTMGMVSGRRKDLKDANARGFLSSTRRGFPFAEELARDDAMIRAERFDVWRQMWWWRRNDGWKPPMWCKLMQIHHKRYFQSKYRSCTYLLRFNRRSTKSATYDDFEVLSRDGSLGI